MKNGRTKISVYIALSIDGYIARKDDSLDWLDRVGGFDEDYGFLQMLAEMDAFLRKICCQTWDQIDLLPCARHSCLSLSEKSTTG